MQHWATWTGLKLCLSLACVHPAVPSLCGRPQAVHFVRCRCIWIAVWMRSFCWQSHSSWSFASASVGCCLGKILWNLVCLLGRLFFSAFPLNQKGLFSWESVQFKFTDLPLVPEPWSYQSLLSRRSLLSRNPHTPFIRTQNTVPFYLSSCSLRSSAMQFLSFWV